MTPVKWVYSFLEKYRYKMAAGLLMVTGIALLTIVNPYISGRIVDDVITGGNYKLLPVLIGCLLGVVALKGILRYASQVMFEICSQGVLYSMRDAVYRKLLQEDFSFYNKNRTGDLMSRQTGDMDAIRHFIAYIIYSVYENILLLSFALIMIFTVNVKLALAMLVVLPFTALTTYGQSKSVRPAFMKIRQQFSSLNTFVQENISGNRVVKAFAREDFEIEKFNKENDAYRDAELNAAAIWKKYVPIFEFLSNILTVVLMLYGGYMVIQGEITMGNLVTVNGYLWMLTVPLRMAGWWINDIHRFTTSAEKIYTTYSQEPEIQEPQQPIVRKHFHGDVEFKNVSYQAEDADIIHDISFKVKSGQTVGIIGSTGSGKSTIMNLLCRFYDTSKGEVLVDGVNVKNLDLYDLRDNIGMAMQDVFLFSDTILENVKLGKKDTLTLSSIKEASRRAQASSFIEKMESQYDTVIGERGIGLSGGQKQRITIARALARKAPVLVLDDSTSALDMETEQCIHDTLRELKDVTKIIIGHRISAVCHADEILILENGQIVERGTHDELLAKKGHYYQTFVAQYGVPESEVIA